MATQRLTFTKTLINALPLPDKGRTTYRDTQIKGLALAVHSTGTKSFYLTKAIHSATEKFFLGRFPDISVDEARAKAQVRLSEIIQGKDPLAERDRERNELTLGELYHQYMEGYSKLHKKSWRYDEREIPMYLSCWFDRKLSEIKRADVRDKHKQVFKKSGKYQANRLLERLRAMYNKAIEWDWDGNNPAVGIKKFREKSRDRFVQPEEMPYLLKAIEEDNNETMRDYLKVLLFTGARRTNTLKMRFDEINTHNCQWTIPETKNGEKQTVVLVPKVMEIINRRRSTSNSQWVFPHANDDKQPMSDPSRAWERIRLRATLNYWKSDSGSKAWVSETMLEWLQREEVQVKIKFSPTWLFEKDLMQVIIEKAKADNAILPPTLTDVRLHDLRRTLGSYQAISGSSLQTIGSSLGHKSLQATQIYARLNLQSVRSSVETATDLMMAC